MSTQTELNELKSAYARGVLKVREGDTWLEYQSMKDMRIAIQDLEKQLSSSVPTGTRLISTSKGY
jgi:hypothetical protein